MDKKYGVKVIDLTRIFGKGNEPATIEEFKAMYPLDYYDYNASELISLKADTLRTIGFNVYDNSVGYARVKKGMRYEISGTYTSLMFKKNLTDTGTTLTTETYTIGQGGQTINPYTGFITESDGYVYVTGGDDTTCIHLVWSGYKNGEYEPYDKHTISLPITTIVDSNGNTLFPNGLRSAGSVYDEITSTKAIKRIGAVDLGTLDWSYTQPNDNHLPHGLFTTTIPDIPYIPIGTTNIFNAVNVKYKLSSNITSFPSLSAIDKHCFRSNNGGLQGKQVCITDSSYTDANTFKEAMSGVMLYYELETPIEVYFSEVPQSFGTTLNLTYAMNDFGTEEILVSNSIDEVPTAPMAHSTFYMNNLKDKIRNIDGNTDDGAMMNDSLTNLLLTLGTALNGTITKTWNETNNNWEFSFTPNANE